MKHRIIILVWVALLSACGGGSVSPPSNSATSLDPFIHTWAPNANCTPLNPTYVDIGSFNIGNIQFVGINMFKTMNFYTDIQCTQAKYQIVYVYNLTWGEVISTTQGQAVQVSAPAPGIYSYSGFEGSQLNPYVGFGLPAFMDILAVQGQYLYLGDQSHLDTNGFPTALQASPSYTLVK